MRSELMILFSKGFILALAIFVWSPASALADEQTTSPISIAEVLANIEHFYVDNIDTEKLNQQAVDELK